MILFSTNCAVTKFSRPCFNTIFLNIQVTCSLNVDWDRTPQHGSPKQKRNYSISFNSHCWDIKLQRVQVLISLEHDSAIAICWFESNYMKLNTEKCHLLISGNKNEHMWAKVGNDKIWESNTVKLLGITIDNQLKFNEHVLNICKKASRKLSALSRMSSFLNFDKKIIILRLFFSLNSSIDHQSGCFMAEK